MNKFKKAILKARKNGEFVKKARNPNIDKTSFIRRLSQNELFVEYTETKVRPVDPKTLRKNKLVAQFQEFRVTEQIKKLRIQVLEKLNKIGGNSFLITSANGGEGKTFTSINLGIALSQELDKTVVLVDADLRNPSFKHQDFSNDFFGIRPEAGLSDYLTGQASISDILLNPGIQKLTILPGGEALANSTELMGSPRMAALVSEMKSRYSERIVIFDTPALLVCTDAALLSRFVDGILLVVEEEKTSKEDLAKVMELLEGRVILGSILNKSRG